MSLAALNAPAHLPLFGRMMLPRQDSSASATGSVPSQTPPETSSSTSTASPSTESGTGTTTSGPLTLNWNFCHEVPSDAHCQFVPGTVGVWECPYGSDPVPLDQSCPPIIEDWDQCHDRGSTLDRCPQVAAIGVDRFWRCPNGVLVQVNEVCPESSYDTSTSTSVTTTPTGQGTGSQSSPSAGSGATSGPGTSTGTGTGPGDRGTPDQGQSGSGSSDSGQSGQSPSGGGGSGGSGTQQGSGGGTGSGSGAGVSGGSPTASRAGSGGSSVTAQSGGAATSLRTGSTGQVAQTSNAAVRTHGQDAGVGWGKAKVVSLSVVALAFGLGIVAVA